MRMTSYVLVVVGIILILVAILNKYALNHALTSGIHLSDYVIGFVGLVIAVIGVVMMLLGGRKAA